MNDQRLRNALGYKRFRGPTRVLIFDTGYHVVGDVLDGAAELGWQALALPTKVAGKGEDHFVVELLGALVQHRPDFLLTLSHTGFDEEGVLAGLLDRYALPLASWFVDHPAPTLGGAPGNVTGSCQVFCIERSALSWLAQIGFSDPVYLPSASNRRLFHPDRLNRRLRLGAKLSFVGSSWWHKARVEPSAAVREAVAGLRGKLITEGAQPFINKAMVRRGIGEILAAIGTIGTIGSGGDPGQRAAHGIAQVALAEAAMEERGRLARTMAELGLHIYGDPGWRELLAGVAIREGNGETAGAGEGNQAGEAGAAGEAAAGITLLPTVDYRTELPAVFAGSQVNLNLTSVQLPTGVNQRIWDVPGAGGFLLTDAQEDAVEFFRDEVDVALYRDPEEARDKARHYLAHPAARAAIAARGFARVEQAHRYPARLLRIAEVMRARFG